MNDWHCQLADETATTQFGQEIAAHLTPGFCLYLQGELGAGKTTLTRSVLRALGHAGSVKSPTFTLVEPYALAMDIYHFDFYRINDPEELLFMGVRDYFRNDSICIVEWPEKAGALIPKADLLVSLQFKDTGRMAVLSAQTDAGNTMLKALEKGRAL